MQPFFPGRRQCLLSLLYLILSLLILNQIQLILNRKLNAKHKHSSRLSHPKTSLVKDTLDNDRFLDTLALELMTPSISKNNNKKKDSPQFPKKSNITFEKAYKEYVSFLNETLSKRNFKNQRVIVILVNNLCGLGNRLPIITAGFLWAMLTKSIFLTNFEDFTKYFDPTDLIDVQITTYMDDVNSQLTNPPLNWECDNALFDTLLQRNLSEALPTNQTIRFDCLDFPMLPLYANPIYAADMKAMFPRYTSFHQLSKKLFPMNAVTKFYPNMFWDRYLSQFDVVIGVHFRRYKFIPRRKYAEHANFVSLVSLIRDTVYDPSKTVAVYLASDDIKSKKDMTTVLKKSGFNVFYQSGDFLNNKTAAGNPGTEESAMFDLAILSMCNELVYTYSSSFGGIASGLGNTPGYLVRHEKIESEPDDAWFTKALTSEPCFYHAGRYIQTTNKGKLLKTSPLWLEQSQCHYYD